MWRLRASSPEKNVFDYSKSEAILTYEYLTKRKENCSSHYRFQFVLISISTPKKERKEGKQNEYFAEKRLKHYRKSFSVVMETQKAQARKKKSE